MVGVDAKIKAGSEGVFLSQLRKNMGIVIVFILLFITMSLLSDSFLTAYNLLNVARQITIVAILGIGMTFVILSGEIDLSVGSIVALIGCLTTGFMISGLPVTVSIIIGLLLGVALGFINGFVTTYGRIPSFIVTLGMMTIARGLSLVYTDGYPISNLPESFSFIGRGYIGPIPFPVVVMAVCFIVGFIVLKYTRFGRNVYALGGNEEAARLSGIKTKSTKVSVFVISGLAAAIAGIILASRLNSGQPSAGTSMELDAIAAVVIGGTSFSGGKGSIIGTLIGALITGVISNGLNLLGVSSYWQMITLGLIIVGAVWIDQFRKE
ncbi:MULTISPECIES: ABC transporter permease [unclassified Paenibacillus]|uniref:ABC transporter permease n=1 Tax=unclassified Paenibacillus TaxID=185978 RepID=UPI001C112643|nr:MULTISPECIES: ABC transporter permease [unclassified Paenibacillus]MBU5444548.1 ABC transporter permease [Paenibacillus sp. MSJ-34]CAH0120214.1 Ribose import permease protein RbsC [Paenibacillus sp. CECT 9249]